MASTYKPYRAFEYAGEFIKRMNLNEVGHMILDHALKHMWMTAPWRWTVGALTPVTLASNTEDYTITRPTPTDDMLYLLRAQYVQAQAGGKDGARDLDIESYLPTNVIIGQPSAVALTSSTNLRVFPKPGTLSGTNQIVLQYKKTCSQITKQNMHTAGVQVFDDEWFPVYVQGVLYYAYMFADDTRAGSASVQPGGTAYSGQLGVYRAALNEMALREKLPSYPTPRTEPTVK